MGMQSTVIRLNSAHKPIARAGVKYIIVQGTDKLKGLNAMENEMKIDFAIK